MSLVAAAALLACEGRVGALGVDEAPVLPGEGRGNAAPVVEAHGCDPVEGVVPHEVTCVVLVSDPDGDRTECELTGPDGVPQVVPCTGGVARFTVVTAGTAEVRLSAKDLFGATVEATVGVVTLPNGAPELQSFTASPLAAPVPHEPLFHWTVSDPEGDALRCELDVDGDGAADWSQAPCAPDGVGQAAMTFEAEGTRTVRLRIEDGWGNAVERTVQVTSLPPPTVDIVIGRVDLAQSVVGEDVRLVSGKPALVRAHVLANEPGVTGAVVKVSGLRGGTVLGTLTMEGPTTLPLQVSEGNLAQSFRAMLPEAWVAAGLTLQVHADATAAVPEKDEENNVRLVTPKLGPGAVLPLTVVPVVYQGVQASTPDIAGALWRFWPVRQVNTQTRAPYTFSGTLSSSSTGGWGQLLQEIGSVRAADGSGRYYYGFVRPGYQSGIAGIGYVGAPVATGMDNSLSTAVHELGHNFGRQHAPCGVSGDPQYPHANARLGTWGFDLATGGLIAPYGAYDVMSYCGPVWVSDYHYGKVQTFLEQTQGLLGEDEESEGDGAEAHRVESARLLVAGRLVNGAVEVRPLLRMLTAAPPAIREGPFTLRLYLGNRVVEVPFAVTALGDGDERHFTLLLDDPGAVLAVEIRDAAGRTLGTKLAAPPRAASFEPRLKELDGVLVLEWDAAAQPWASVAHVGAERTTLGLWLTGGRASLPVDGLPAGGELELGLSDGVNAARWRLPRAR